MIGRVRALSIALAALVVAPPSASADDGLEDKIRAVLPTPDEERWAGIPWQTNLALARRAAQAQGKPILVWTMDGHVLGCT